MITEFHRQNLLTLGRYLSGDEIAMKFDISDFNNSEEDYGPHSCGTAGCAVGHGPYAGFEPLPAQSWADYCACYFCECDSEEGHWMFGAGWQDADNTAIGAAKRIFWYLKHGVPKGWHGQRAQGGPFCYSDMDISEFMETEAPHQSVNQS